MNCKLEQCSCETPRQKNNCKFFIPPPTHKYAKCLLFHLYNARCPLPRSLCATCPNHINKLLSPGRPKKIEGVTMCEKCKNTRSTTIKLRPLKPVYAKLLNKQHAYLCASCSELTANVCRKKRQD